MKIVEEAVCKDSLFFWKNRKVIFKTYNHASASIFCSWQQD